MHSVIGVMRERVIEKFITGLPRRFDVAKGPAQFCAVLIHADDATGRCTKISRILKREETAVD
jgi:calcineurin-like phosphoesterase